MVVTQRSHANLCQVVISIFADGFIKAEGPGSLRDPRPTTLFPTNWKAVPLALGLLMGKTYLDNGHGKIVY